MEEPTTPVEDDIVEVNLYNNATEEPTPPVHDHVDDEDVNANDDDINSDIVNVKNLSTVTLTIDTNNNHDHNRSENVFVRW